MLLQVKNLQTGIENKQILHGISLDIEQGKIHALMGQNGSGKSTMAQVLMGNPVYEVLSGEVSFNDRALLALEPNERAAQGLFLSFQYPSEVSGVTISNYLRLIYNKSHEKQLSPVKFREFIKEKLELLEMSDNFMSRYLNEGFSGGEKKRMEMLQMLVLEPKLAILDEVDSGLDIDALKVVSKAVNHLVENANMAVLIITHYTRILKYIHPDFVHVMKEGQLVRTGDHSLAHELEEKGYVF